MHCHFILGTRFKRGLSFLFIFNFKHCVTLSRFVVDAL
jgi:hypothetical protein